MRRNIKEMNMKKEVFVSVSTDPMSEYQLICEYAQEMQGVSDFLHCDIMDGKFVPKVTFDDQLVANINSNSLIMLDVHLMCEEPLEIIDDYLKAGANIITVHYEAFKDKNDIIKVLHKIKKANALAGISIKPETPVNEIKIYAHDFDVILVMSVEPGASGQKFMPEAFEKIKQLDEIRKANNYKYKIEVDGGVNSDNAAKIAEAGADMLVSGSYVYKARDRRKAIESLKVN